MGNIQSTEGLQNKNVKEGKGWSLKVFELCHESFPELPMGSCAIYSLVLRSSDLDWTIYHGSPGSPACRQQIMELFSLCKHHASQLLYTHIHTCGCVCVYTMFTVLKSIQHTYTECLLLSRQCLNLPRPHGAIYFSFVDCSGLQDNRAKQHYCSIICICYWLCSLEKSDSHPRLYDLYDMAFPED